MPVVNLTAAKLQNLDLSSGKTLELWDARTARLCLRVLPSGRATWTVRYRPHSGDGYKRMTLGHYPAVGLADARARAERCRGCGEIVKANALKLGIGGDEIPWPAR